MESLNPSSYTDAQLRSPGLRNSLKNTRGFRAISRRFDSLFNSTGEKGDKSGDLALDSDEPIPEAKVDIALVGVEHAGKSTFFKQITSMYTPEDFRQLVGSDGKSQAVGTLLKITNTVLKSVKPSSFNFQQIVIAF